MFDGRRGARLVLVASLAACGTQAAPAATTPEAACAGEGCESMASIPPEDYIPEERACRVDDDCVASTFPGCCACCRCAEASATRRDHLEESESQCWIVDCAEGHARRCDEERSRAPCAPCDEDVGEAVCVRGLCVLAREAG